MVRICSLATMFIITFVTPQSQAASEGEELFDACRSCHMDDGMGSETLGAPAIAGLPEWYITAQLEKFVKGQRGYDADDEVGLRMRPMASSMNHDGTPVPTDPVVAAKWDIALEWPNVPIVAAYVSALPNPGVPATFSDGDAELGKVAYIKACQFCHGAKGLGVEMLKGPPLKGQTDWYMMRQLQSFKAGIRGTAPGDVSGKSMQNIFQSDPTILADDAAMQNVIAYIKTL